MPKTNPKKRSGKPLPEVNIGMVGHIDHGKTTLTKILTGKWTSVHSEELKRGISIRIGYADATFYKCPKCKGPDSFGTTEKCMKCFSTCKPLRTVSFVDVPGHEMLMTAVLSASAIMDGALLVISAHEKCPQPQTREHLTTLEIAGIKNIVIAQNKIDLVTKEEAEENYRQIKEFVRGTIAEGAPIIPVSAQHNINIDLLIEAIEKFIPTKKREKGKDPVFYIARSFDVNKPGTKLADLSGGVVGGSLVSGSLKVGEVIEIKPGMKIGDKYKPIETKIITIHKMGQNIDKVEPGGLIALGTGLDPYLTKADGLAGNILGLKGKLPPCQDRIEIDAKLLERVVGSKEDLNVEPIKTDDALILTIGVTRTLGTVISAGKRIKVDLKIPVCSDKGQRVAISRQVQGRWRLIGWGQIV